MIINRLARAISLGLIASNSLAADFHLQRYDLPNGVHVIVGQVPDAARQTVLTFLPLTMVNDETHRAQWAHLVEHMLIRTTDPEGLHAPGIRFNGETTTMYLRLETFAEVSKWKDALAKHGRWVSARTFDADALQREKKNIQSEEDSTSQFGNTTKFALAAWNQVVNHGVDQVHVHGDVAGAVLQDVQKYVADHVAMNDSVTIASIGPIPADEVRQEIERVFGGMARGGAKPPASDDQPKQLAGAQQATWDLPTTHAMWWWKLPDRKPETLAAATVAARVVQFSFVINPARKKMVRVLQTYLIIDTPHGPVLLIDACLPQDGSVKLDDVLREIKAAYEEFKSGKGGATAQNLAAMILLELHPDPEFTGFRMQVPPSMRPMAEGVWLLSQMNYEYQWRVPIDQVTTALKNIDEQVMKTMLDLLGGAPTGTLMLEPIAARAQPAATQPGH